MPPKDAYYRKDMADWARHLGLKMIRPSVSPVVSVKSLRGPFFAIDEGRISAYSRAVFQAYWQDDRDISDSAVLGDVATAAGLDSEVFLTRIGEDDIKQRLFATTDEIIERGGFGSPTFFIDGDDMYFGNDRMELMRAALDRKAG